MRSPFRLSLPQDHARRIDDILAELRAVPLVLNAEVVPLIEARLLCGDFEAVRPLIANAAPHPALPLVVARYHAWSADLGLVMSAFEIVRASLPLLEGAGTALRQATWPELERTATDVGDPVLASRLVRLAREESGAAPAAPAEDVGGRLLSAIQPLLGVDPDAHRGRLRLRPRIGTHPALRMEELRFADGAVSLDVRRNGTTIVYRVAQEAGAMPFTVLLEPIVAGPVGAAEVDGRSATLDVRPHGGDLLVPVQLVADEERTLTLYIDGK